jgi:hypothetical protein
MNPDRGEHMRRLLLGAFILLTCASECSANGAIAYGYDGSIMRFVAVTNVSTITGSQLQAMEKCRSAGLARCEVALNFEDSCAAVAVSAEGLHNTSKSTSAESARRDAFFSCNDLRRTACRIAAVACDGTASPDLPSRQNNEPTPPEQSAWFWFAPPPFEFPPPLVREVETALAISRIAQLTLLACCLWIFVSIFSSTIDVFKSRVSISAWIGLPTIVAYALTTIRPNFDYVPYLPATVIYLWADVFIALMIGGKLRQHLSSSWRKPRSLSLPFATFAFTIFSFMFIGLFIKYGTPLSQPSCASRYFLLSACGYFMFEGFYFSAAGFLVLIACGAILPADSEPILAYDNFNAFLRKAFQNFLANRRERQAQEAIERAKEIAARSSSSYPAPTIYQSKIADRMCLKLKRSQRSSSFGKPLFVLDARMEVTAEEAELVRKYRLGDDVIYESSSRQRHQEATRAHLEMTKSGPGFTDSTKSQLLGAGSTLYRLARATVSATAAALSLRITVSSLMSGVHIECKSMGELLGAETAIVEAAQNLRSYLDTAATFDGREEIIEF